MKIVYVGNHDSGGNDDEGAVTHALQQLGHNVQRVREKVAHSAWKVSGDVLLFHKWPSLDHLKKCHGRIPLVFWYFDLVYWPDDSLTKRNHSRMQWMDQRIPLVDVGFCTDGDFVAQDQSGKLVWLMQGADTRVAGRGTPDHRQSTDLLFCGGAGGCRDRIDWHRATERRWPDQLRTIERGVYGRPLADAVASAKVVLGPAAPVTDKYWSNRVYVMQQFGSCLLHKRSAGLAQQYTEGQEILFYDDAEDMHTVAQTWLNMPKRRQDMQSAALARTLREHTYRHRCEEMMAELKRRGIG